MTTQPTTQKRWRPRFSLRTLVILLTLVCVYLSCWMPTSTRGVDDVAMQLTIALLAEYGSPEDPVEVIQRMADFRQTSSKVPFVVGVNVNDGLMSNHREYYFWFFGYVAKLPYERDL